ncbi:hypothetical protein [Kribbella kalugense]|nr:hypothetical protein [Kribbella kalugense]
MLDDHGVPGMDAVRGLLPEMDAASRAAMPPQPDTQLAPAEGIVPARQTTLVGDRLSTPPVFRRRFVEQLRRHRSVLLEAWSPETVYPGTDAMQLTDQPASKGQCGVSSAWLLPRLSWLRRFRATYCVGYVVFEGRDSGSDVLHCWIEIGGTRSGRRLVIDLTCDQFDDLSDRDLVCEPYKTLVNQSIEYRAGSRMRFNDLRHDPVWHRYERLDADIRHSTQQRLAL